MFPLRNVLYSVVIIIEDQPGVDDHPRAKLVVLPVQLPGLPGLAQLPVVDELGVDETLLLLLLSAPARGVEDVGRLSEVEQPVAFRALQRPTYFQLNKTKLI